LKGQSPGRTRNSLPTDTRAPSRGRIVMLVAGTALILVVYHALTWRSFVNSIDAFKELFCDFVIYYYPMGEAIFRTGLPIDGFLYSPFIAILLAIFPPLGLTASLVLWGVVVTFGTGKLLFESSD
jgi:hypothetical protein